MCKSKIHRATVTGAKLDYTGSITIDTNLMEAAGILPFEMVHINSMSNAAHWETYAIPGGDGEITLNGCPARLFMPGDEVVILSLVQVTPEEARTLADRMHRTVQVDKQNHRW
jgi:aspartate 1-decarboxylase